MRMNIPFRPLLVLACLACVPLRAEAGGDYILMVGPMLHFNGVPGKAGSQWSLGVEASFWTGVGIPLGVDVGLEYNKGDVFRLYSELETGYVFAGVGAGPVIELSPRGITAGVQASPWINCFVGADYRVRKLIGRPMETAPGLYAKAPAHVPEVHLLGQDTTSDW